MLRSSGVPEIVHHQLKMEVPIRVTEKPAIEANVAVDFAAWTFMPGVGTGFLESSLVGDG